jgi:hypothetical protein
VASTTDDWFMPISTDPFLHYDCSILNTGRGSIAVYLSVGNVGDSSYAAGWAYQIVVQPQSAT